MGVDNDLVHNWRDIANTDNPDYDATPVYLYEANITHNLNRMGDAAGIYEYLWRPDELNITTAKELIEPLEKGLKSLKRYPKKYQKYNSPNGWGMYEHFVPFVENYLNACKEFPEAKIEISR